MNIIQTGKDRLDTSPEECDLILNIKQCHCGGTIDRRIQKSSFRPENDEFGISLPVAFVCRKCNAFGDKFTGIMTDTSFYEKE
jgi:hypothetical protein